MEQYPKHYVNFKQNDWIYLLSLLLTYNNQQQGNKISPFYSNFGRHSNWDPTNNITSLTSEAANIAIQDIIKLQKAFNKRIRQQWENKAQWVNKKKLKRLTFRREDKIYLLTKNLKSKWLSHKLNHVKIKPFKVEKQTNNVNYQLELQTKAQIHLNLYISLLEPAPKNRSIQTKWNIEEDKEYDIKKVLNSKRVNSKDQYLVKWLGHRKEENL